MSVFGIAPEISEGNSTTTALGVATTFTGTWQRATRSMVVCQLFSDVAGTLFFDFSVDGANADSTSPVGGVSVTANIPTVQPAAVGGRYFRIRFVKDATNQTVFRVGTSFNDITNFYSPLNQPYNLQSPSILTRPSWTWLDVARGLAGGVTSVEKFGRNNNVGTAFVPICLGGVYPTPQSGSATTLRIAAGGDANDTAAGTGAREVTLIGLDENFEPVTETIATAGASASSVTSATFTRLFRFFVSASGTYATASVGSHAGAITIENSAGGTTWGVIGATDFPKSQSEVGAFSVPAGRTAFVKLKNITADTGKTVDLIFFHRGGIDETSAPYTAMRAQSVVAGLDGGFINAYGQSDVPLGPYVGPCDFGYMGKVDTGTAEISVEFEIVEIDS